MKPVKRRAESFFGLHFDFHATPEKCAGVSVGETLSEDEIREICTLLHPDFIQIDCKGHPGYASYPSKLGNAMPDFTGDPLALWRKVTAEEGVALYMHYSGIRDHKYVAEHPEEAAKSAGGAADGQCVRANGAYVDDLMIPQLLELAEYGVDGVWVDGDCWAARLDFDLRTVKAFEEKTGITLQTLPTSREHPHYDEYREFCRELFRAYVRHYTDAVHAKYPNFQVASNWSYTDHMPEPISANVDFISGDLNPQNSFNSARYAGRAIARQNYTWDLMSWNFRSVTPTSCPKHVTQLLQEAAAVISLGGGFQNYITQLRDGSPRMNEIRLMKQLEEFMRPREEYCFRGKFVRQVGILLSMTDRNKESASLYTRNGNEKIMGLTSLICDCSHSVEHLGEWMNFADYPVIAVPEVFAGLAPETVKQLLEYAENGGSLLVLGAKNAEQFAAAGMPFTLGEKVEGTRYFRVGDGEYLGTVTNSRAVSGEGKVIATVCNTFRDPAEPLAMVAPYGKGKIAVLPFDLGTVYQTGGQFLHKDLMNALLAELYTPIVRVDCEEGTVEMSLLEKNGKTEIQLVNANGTHRDTSVWSDDKLLPCRNVTLKIRLANRPASVTLQPEHKPLQFSWWQGVATVTVEKVAVHEIVEVE